MRWNVVAVVWVGLGAGGCKTTVFPDSGETGYPQCDAICSASLAVDMGTLADSTYALTVTGAGFSSLSLGCPEGVFAGGPPGTSVGCTATGFEIGVLDYQFPSEITFTLTVTDQPGVDRTVQLDLTDVEMCGTTCNTAELTLDFGS